MPIPRHKIKASRMDISDFKCRKSTARCTSLLVWFQCISVWFIASFETIWDALDKKHDSQGDPSRHPGDILLCWYVVSGLVFYVSFIAKASCRWWSRLGVCCFESLSIHPNFCWANTEQGIGNYLRRQRAASCFQHFQGPKENWTWIIALMYRKRLLVLL